MSFIASTLVMYWIAPFIIKGVIATIKYSLLLIAKLLRFTFQHAPVFLCFTYNAVKNYFITKIVSSTNSSSKNLLLDYDVLLVEVHDSVLQAENTSLSISDRKVFYINSLKLIDAINELYPDKDALTYGFFLSLNLSSVITVH